MNRTELIKRILRASFASMFSVALLVAGVFLGAMEPQVASAASCHHISGPFHDRGNKVYNKQGKRYIPYGITITGLGNPNWASHHTDPAEIVAANGAWCSNTVRLQIFQDGLINPHTYAVNPTFLALVKSEVNQALALGLIVDINDQSEGAAAGTEYMPNKESRKFWKVMTGAYGHNPDVIFDLLNEPRRTVFPSTDATWRFWRNGGVYGGVPYMGMETIAKYVRSIGSRNLFWIEGPHTASILSLVPIFRLSHVGAVEYGINHAGSHSHPTPQTPAYWNINFGYASRSVPIVNSEWTTYASTRGCTPNAPKTVPVYLRYLANHGIGMTAWTLAPGVLAAGSNLSIPTRFKSNWACKNGLDEGAGHQVMTWFHLHN